MSDELSALSGPSGLEPGEKVPNELRILASTESLGALRSVHRPATRTARIALKKARVYRYDLGVVLSNGRGGLGLYRYDQITVAKRGKDWFLQRADGVLVRLSHHWSEIEPLGTAVEQGVAQYAQAARDGAASADGTATTADRAAGTGAGEADAGGTARD